MAAAASACPSGSARWFSAHPGAPRTDPELVSRPPFLGIGYIVYPTPDVGSMEGEM